MWLIMGRGRRFGFKLERFPKSQYPGVFICIPRLLENEDPSSVVIFKWKAGFKPKETLMNIVLDSNKSQNYEKLIVL